MPFAGLHYQSINSFSSATPINFRGTNNQQSFPSHFLQTCFGRQLGLTVSTRVFSRTSGADVDESTTTPRSRGFCQSQRAPVIYRPVLLNIASMSYSGKVHHQ